MIRMAGIKRHESMQPLSRHHHHALMTALNIRKVLEAGEVTEEQLESLRHDCLEFWDKDGNEHFREEEEILMPAYARYASVRHEEMIEMLLEHVQIRALYAAIRERDGDMAEHFRNLSEALDRHVRREERIIFPMMEEALPEDALQKLAPYFHEFH